MTATTTVQDGVAELRRFLNTREPWMIDVAIAGAYFLIAIAFSGSNGYWMARTAVWAMFFAVPMFLVRRHPRVGLAISVALTGAIVVLGFDGGTPTLALFLPLVVTTFATAMRPGSVNVLILLATAAVFLLGYVLVAPYALGDGVAWLLFFGVVVAIGWGVRWFRNARTERLARAGVEIDRDLAEQAMAIEQERGRVAREVHDIVAHSLAVVIAQADGARYTAEQHPDRVAPALAAIADTARSSLGEIRLLLHELRQTDGLAPTPVYRDVDTLVDGVRELGLQVDVASYGPRRELPDEAQAALFRIVQEALTNALRHGDRTRPVRLDTEWGDRTLTVTNDLLPDGVPQIAGPGHGIPGMRERTQLAGGDFAVGVGDNGRFRVRASLPVPVGDGAETRLVPVAAAG